MLSYKEIVSIGEKSLQLKEWEEISSIPWKTIAKRLERGWSPENAINLPIGSQNPDKEEINCLLGQKFGRLFIKEKTTGPDKWRTYYICVCDCGEIIQVPKNNLTSGNTQSCGCLQRQRSSEAKKSYAREAYPREYRAWKSMRQRCSNPRDPEFSRYGGRGISVSSTWDSFIQFMIDIGPKDHPSLSLDRINCNGNYEPGNVRWADSIQQANNRRSNHMITYKGVTASISDTARRIGMSPFTLRDRIGKYGWSIEDAIETPVNK